MPVALAEGTVFLPPDHLPFFEPFEKLSFWFPRDIAAFETAFVAYGRAVCDGLVSECFVLDNADFVRHAAGICDVLRHSCHLDPSAMGQVVQCM